MKIEEMADVFLNLANFAPHALLNLTPRCQQLAEHLSFHMKYLDLLLKENLIRQTSFLRENTSQKPAFFSVKIAI